MINNMQKIKKKREKKGEIRHKNELISLFDNNSAGIGRTGTYIAIDALHNEHKFNIAEYVKKMREKRMNMVQTYVSLKLLFA